MFTSELGITLFTELCYSNLSWATTTRFIFSCRISVSCLFFYFSFHVDLDHRGCLPHLGFLTTFLRIKSVEEMKWY